MEIDSQIASIICEIQHGGSGLSKNHFFLRLFNIKNYSLFILIYNDKLKAR